MRNLKAALLLGCAMLVSSCGGGSGTSGSATPEEADKFVEGLNADLRKMLPYQSSAAWLQATYITDDSQMIASRASEEYLAWQSRKVEEAKRFNDVKGMKPETARALMLLKNVSAPAPSDPALQAELAKILSKMEANYGSAKWCRAENDCLNLTEIEKIINNPDEKPEVRAAAWKGWQETARVIRKDYQRFVEIVNTGAKEMGFADAGEVWRGGYDMAPDAFAQETERLWTQVKPLYEQLHCYVRGKLNTKYGDAVVPKDGKGIISISSQIGRAVCRGREPLR